jgi:hypothetical protein
MIVTKRIENIATGANLFIFFPPIIKALSQETTKNKPDRNREDNKIPSLFCLDNNYSPKKEDIYSNYNKIREIFIPPTL